jgi:hypothetical protein
MNIVSGQEPSPGPRSSEEAFVSGRTTGTRSSEARPSGTATTTTTTTTTTGTPRQSTTVSPSNTMSISAALEHPNALPHDTARISAKLKNEGEPGPPSRATSNNNLWPVDSGPSFLKRVTFFSSPLVDGGPKATLHLDALPESPSTQLTFWSRTKNTLEVGKIEASN